MADPAATRSAKEVEVRPIPTDAARKVIAALHYSGKFTRNSQVHLGAFLDGRLQGAMSFGPPVDRAKMLHLVTGSEWGSVIELNRMAFGEGLPRNSESRCLGVAFRMLAKRYPQLKWVISFADAAQCGDGAIYRASGFVLTQIKRTESMARLPNGDVVHILALHTVPRAPRPELGGRSFFEVTGGRYTFDLYLKAAGAELLGGYQLRYIKFLDPAWRERLTVPEIPFARIADLGAGMYRGQPR